MLIIRVTVITGQFSGIIPEQGRILVYFKKKYPNITLDLTVKSSTDILNDLKQKNPAIGICLAKHTSDTLNQKVLFNQRYYLYCGYHHPLFSVKDLSISNILEENFILINTFLMNILRYWGFYLFLFISVIPLFAIVRFIYINCT